MATYDDEGNVMPAAPGIWANWNAFQNSVATKPGGADPMGSRARAAAGTPLANSFGAAGTGFVNAGLGSYSRSRPQGGGGGAVPQPAAAMAPPADATPWYLQSPQQSSMAPATTMSSRAGTDFTASAPAPASPGAVIPATTTAGIYRNGNTYSDTQTPGSTPLVGYGATGGKGGTVNTVPAAAFTGGSPGDSAALQAARQAAADRGDFGAVRDSYQANGGTFLGKTAAQDAHTKALADAQRGIYTAKTIPQQKNAIDLYNHMVTAEATGVHNTAQITQAQAETARKGREDAMKGYTDLLKAQADGDEKAATAAVKKLQYGAAVSHLANGGTPAEAAHIAGGGALTADHYSVPITYMGGFGAKDQVPLVNQTKGTLKTVTPSAQVNEANITQHMKETGMSRAQSIAAHKARGFDTSALK